MANSIALFQKYINELDYVYKLSARTSALDIDGALVQAGANANEIIIPKMSMDGLADYSRNGGYVTGNVNLTNETVKFNYDRGRKFTVDSMDNEETAGLAFGKLSSEFIRTKVVPEMDAVRFASYAGVEGISSVSADLTTGESVLAAINAANTTIDEAEVPTDGRYLFITPTLKALADNVDTYKSKAMMERFAGVIEVPQTRFYTAIDLHDGTTDGETAGGFVKDADSGKNINFMIIHKEAVIQFSKHTVNKIFTPEENQNSDGYIFCYRAYGLTDAYENKAAGIYLHAATT
jgi:hypothetical protein